MNMKKMLAVSMSAAMVMGMAMPVMAASTNPTVDATAPIYSYEVENVIVPTTYKVAFNPEGLTIKTGDSTTSTNQIVSKNYGIINKGSKDKVVTVALKIEDKNTTNQVEFVGSADDVTNAEEGEYKIHLTAVPADATNEVKVGTTPASADKDTAATALEDVSMTGETTKAVTLNPGDNKIAFKLDKATYDPSTSDPLELGDTGNNVSANFTLASLAGSGKGITAFTFGGEMNANADWTKLTSGIGISAVYTWATAPAGTTPITGTGAMVDLGPQISANGAGLITISALTATKNFASAEITVDGETANVEVAPVEWIDGEWSESTGGTLKIQLGAEWKDAIKGATQTSTIAVTLTDDSVITAPITIS